MPRRVSSWPPSFTSRRKFIVVRRRSALGRAAPRAAGAGGGLAADQVPLALSVASGMDRASLARRHSVPAPVVLARLAASISSRPSFLPRSSKSSTTTSMAGMLAVCWSSSASTSPVAVAGMASRDSRATMRPLPAAAAAPGAGCRYSTWPCTWLASTWARQVRPSRLPVAAKLLMVRPEIVSSRARRLNWLGR